MSQKLCSMLCLISKLILCLIWTLQWSLLNVWIWTFSWVWQEHYDGLFNIRNLVRSLILMFGRICLCDTIIYTWFGKKRKRLKKFWGWKIWLVYAYFFKHQSLSMLIKKSAPKNQGFSGSFWVAEAQHFGISDRSEIEKMEGFFRG